MSCRYGQIEAMHGCGFGSTEYGDKYFSGIEIQVIKDAI